MVRTFLIVGCLLIGGAAIFIGSAIALVGIEAVGRFFVAGMGLVYPVGPLEGLGQPNDDSELRFYSVFFVAWGTLLVQAARRMERFGHRIPALLGLFFLGGLARALSWATIGQPHDLFITLMVIELGVPPLLWLAWRRTSRS